MRQIFIIFLSLNCVGQSFEVTYGEALLDETGRVALEIPGEDFIICGNQQFTLSKRPLYISRLDNTGAVVWDWVFDEADDREYVPLAVEQLDDGNILLASILHEEGVDTTRLHLLKFSYDGTEIWSKTHSYYAYTYARQLLQSSDGNVTMVGRVNLPLSNQRDLYIMKLDNLGDTIWTKRYPTFNISDGGTSAIFDSDENLIVSGSYTSVNGLGQTLDSDPYLKKISPTGEIIWEHEYDVGENGYCSKVAEYNDGYVLLGEMITFPDPNRDIILITTDFDGNFNWLNTYGSEVTDRARGVVVDDSGFYVAGSTEDIENGDCDGFLMYTNAVGDSLWGTRFGGDGEDEFDYLLRTVDGNGLLMVGYSETEDAEQVYVVLSDTLGNVSGIESHILDSFNIYPNPSTNEFFISVGSSLQGLNMDIRILNYLGHEVYIKRVVIQSSLVSLHIQGLPPGSYIVHLTSEERLIGGQRLVIY